VLARRESWCEGVHGTQKMMFIKIVTGRQIFFGAKSNFATDCSFESRCRGLISSARPQYLRFTERRYGTVLGQRQS